MGKRYFCDYCQKSFPNGAENRRKHNEGIMHIRLKNDYYKAFTATDSSRLPIYEPIQTPNKPNMKRLLTERKDLSQCLSRDESDKLQKLLLNCCNIGSRKSRPNQPQSLSNNDWTNFVNYLPNKWN